MKAWLTKVLLKLIRANSPPTWGIRPFFLECPTCRKKPGMPTLCRECIERRNLHSLAGHLGLIEYDPNGYHPDPPEKDCWCDENETCSECYDPAAGKNLREEIRDVMEAAKKEPCEPVKMPKPGPGDTRRDG